MSATETQTRLQIPENLTVFLEPALARLGYLHPNITFERQGSELVLNGAEPRMVPGLRRDVLYTLYREKIYAETLPMRQALIREVTGG